MDKIFKIQGFFLKIESFDYSKILQTNGIIIWVLSGKFYNKTF